MPTVERAHREPPTGVEIVLEVDYLHAERDRLRHAGWPIVEDIMRRPWGLQDFRVLDPDGYYLRITSKEVILKPKTTMRSSCITSPFSLVPTC